MFLMPLKVNSQYLKQPSTITVIETNGQKLNTGEQVAASQHRWERIYHYKMGSPSSLLFSVQAG